MQTSGHLLYDVRSHQFGGGIDSVEGRHVVERAIAEGRHHRGERGLDGVKVAQETVGIKPLALHPHHHLPVVPVHGLANPGHDDGVGGGKAGSDGEFVHADEE